MRTKLFLAVPAIVLWPLVLIAINVFIVWNKQWRESVAWPIFIFLDLFAIAIAFLEYGGYEGVWGVSSAPIPDLPLVIFLHIVWGLVVYLLALLIARDAKEEYCLG